MATGQELNNLGRGRKASELLKRSRAAWKRLSDTNPAVTVFQEREARVLNGIGMVLQSTGGSADAVPVFREALSRFQKLSIVHLDEVHLQVRLGYVHNNLGISFVGLGRLAEALNEFAQGAAIFRSLADAYPENTSYRNDQAFRQIFVSDVLRRSGRPADALALDRQTLDLAERLAERDVERDLLPYVLCGLALSFSELGDTVAAVAAVRRAVSLADKQSRDSASHCHDSAMCHAVLWTVCGSAGSGVSEDEREVEAEKAMSLYRSAADLGYKNSINITYPFPEPFYQRRRFSAVPDGPAHAG